MQQRVNKFKTTVRTLKDGVLTITDERGITTQMQEGDRVELHARGSVSLNQKPESRDAVITKITDTKVYMVSVYEDDPTDGYTVGHPIDTIWVDRLGWFYSTGLDWKKIHA